MKKSTNEFNSKRFLFPDALELYLVHDSSKKLPKGQNPSTKNEKLWFLHSARHLMTLYTV